MDPLAGITLVGDGFYNILSCNTGPEAISCYQMQIFNIVNCVFLCNIIGLFGVIANLVNMVVFFKHGFQSTVNISFFSIAISDFSCLLTVLWLSMCLNPYIVAAGAPWAPGDFMYLPGAWPHVVCGRITSYITIFITAERCLSIITPLKVKQIITPKRATIVICVIYIVNILTLVPEYATSYLQFTWFPDSNRTLLAITFTSDRDAVVGLVFIMSSITGISSFVGVTVCTVVLVVKLQQSSQWRKLASRDQEKNLSSRDKKSVKMVAIIASILIVCYTPGTVMGMAIFLVPELNLKSKYHNTGMAMYSIAFVFQSINSSVNIFLYYRMSSNYRQTFHELLDKVIRKESLTKCKT